jgi:hypothetical protein
MKKNGSKEGMLEVGEKWALADAVLEETPRREMIVAISTRVTL